LIGELKLLLTIERKANMKKKEKKEAKLIDRWVALPECNLTDFSISYCSHCMGRKKHSKKSKKMMEDSMNVFNI